MKNKNTPWTAEEEAVLAQAVIDNVSPTRLSVRLRRSEATIKRRMRELGLAGKRRDMGEITRSTIKIQIDPIVQAKRWLEACKSGNLTKLTRFYTEDAMLECACTGPTVYVGLGAIQGYWSSKLGATAPNSFSLVESRVDTDRVVIDYLSYEAKPVRMYLEFNAMGKIIRSECGPRRCTKASEIHTSA